MAVLRRLYNKSSHNAAAAGSASLILLLLLVLSLSGGGVRDRRGGILLGSGVEAGDAEEGICEEELLALEGRAARCRYLQSSHPPCGPQGYVDYLVLFYCACGDGQMDLWWSPWLGGATIGLWLLLLFYLLGDTASEYFCASLEGLSAALRLPPAVAGVTLLSLGNGAPDVLSSVVAFASGGAGDGAGDVGLSGALGGALFVSTVVAGLVSILSARRRGGAGDAVVIERRGFVRDVGFLLVALCYLLAILLAGNVTVWSAAAFLSLYAVYVLAVSASHCCPCAAATADNSTSSADHSDDLAAPLLPVVSSKNNKKQQLAAFARQLLAAPLYLPRRLTIPDIAAHRWSRANAVTSALLAPLLLAAVTCPLTPSFLLGAALTGALLAIAAASTTDAVAPPRGRYARLLWLVGGFLMSVLWSYVLARELVSLLVSTGIIAGIPASVLGVTVLAWGNSLGDLVSDVAMATQEGKAGAQTAVAGCYAGPAFNMVVGLGLSMAIAAAGTYPEPYEVPVQASTYVTVGFLVAGLAWALVVLPARGMRLDAVLGAGLLALYLCFLAVRLADAVGVLSLNSFSLAKDTVT
ncbi:cation/calcium exchanger 1-like [Lolium rigidum]|uniref:cation/calcium exchanger 1-like n=1 Tax=Lolium rigidum TaxID=89674 RepID=UPI001F5D506A|nr:cation/calcium exchanger 1-like [Lolium rigidum]